MRGMTLGERLDMIQYGEDVRTELEELLGRPADSVDPGYLRVVVEEYDRVRSLILRECV